MQYLYPIAFKDTTSKTKYFFGITDIHETNTEKVGHCKEKNCTHNSPAEASDCYRQYLLDNEFNASAGGVEERKCMMRGCAERTDKICKLGSHIEFALCTKHRNKTTVKKICGWGLVLNIRKLE